MAVVSLTLLLQALSETEQSKNVLTNEYSQTNEGEREGGVFGSWSETSAAAQERGVLTTTSFYSSCNLLLLQGDVMLLARRTTLFSD